MVITEKEINNNNENNPKKKKWKKILLSILAIWIGLFLLRILLEENNSMKTNTYSNTFQGFSNIKYGTKKNDVVKAMKKAGWIQIEESQGSMGDIALNSYVFTKNGYKFAKHEITSVRLTFEPHDYFVCFSVLFDTESMNDEERTKLLKDCTSISDFHPSATNTAEDGSPIYGFQNSNGDMCVVGLTKITDHYELSFDYYWFNFIGN